MDGTNNHPREAVGYKIVFVGHMLNVIGVLRDGGELTLLSTRPWLRRLGHGERQRLVVNKSCEPTALQQEAEMTGGEEKSQELPVESAVFPLVVAELPAEKGQRLPTH